MILTSASSTRSERMQPHHAAILRECDEVRTFTECGWYCAMGFKGRDVAVYVHANSRDDYDRMMNPQDHVSDRYGLYGRAPSRRG